MTFSEWADSLTEEKLDQMLDDIYNSPEQIQYRKDVDYIESVGLDNIIYDFCNFVERECAGFFNTCSYDYGDVNFGLSRGVVEESLALIVSEVFEGEVMFFSEASNEFCLRDLMIKITEFHGQGERIFHVEVERID